MTLSATVQVGQAAASGASTKTNPVVDHVRAEALTVGSDEDPDLRGPRMLATLVNDSRSTASTSAMIASSAITSSAHELHLWTGGQQRSELVDNRKGGATRQARRFFLEREDRGCGSAEDRVVELVDGA